MKKFLLMLVALVATCVSAYAQDTYVVAGVSALCGSNWDGTDANNQMTLQDDGTYVKTYTSVAVGKDYQFKVVKNGETWYGDAQGNNVTFVVSTACDVNIYYNPNNNDITVTGEGVGEPTFEVSKVVAVGNGSGNWLNGANWDVTADANKMAEVSDLVYEITYQDVAAGNYQVKFALNGAWTDNFGGTFAGSGVEGDAAYNGGNIEIAIAATSTVTLRLDLTNFDYATKAGAKMTITVVQEGEVTYFMKHPWGGGDWTWKELAKNEDPAWAWTDATGKIIDWGYRIQDYYGGSGCNVNTADSDTGSTWYSDPALIGDIATGDMCMFNYFPIANLLYIVKLEPTGITDVKANAARAYKTIENGQVIIVKDGVKYNVMGAVVK
ncbi:MAG: hypothetical protein Q4B68_08840 [Bacteroidales bacterium]|nr:hypothetical protein [Bacteroidales bacterium]